MDPPPSLNTPSSSTHLFICFPSRLPSSSMKISSKSILSPGRAGARDPPISLSTSLSRKLGKNGSIKGGASPAMFPATAKKRGCGFDNPEPSSPKVTCIGQVRVKSKKKQAKKLRTLSRRHSTGEVSFRKLEHSRDGFSSQSQKQHQSQHLASNHQPGSHSQHQNQECLTGQRSNQRWVHLPLTICETLRAFGSEFSCLFPCRSSCFSTTEREKEEKMAATAAEEEGNRQGSCGAALARWLVALQDGDGGGRCGGGGGRREIELVAEDEDEDDDEEMGVRHLRRHVFEDLEIVNDSIQGTTDAARVSICVPPKNALLLMRCRSDPMKMEALTNRFWEPSVCKNEEEDEDEIEEQGVTQEDLQVVEQQKEEKVMVLDEFNDQELDNVQEDVVDQEKEETDLEQIIQEEENQEQSLEINEEEEEEEEEESMFLGSLFEENVDQDEEFQENYETYSDMEDAQEQLFEQDEDIQETEAGESNIEKVKDVQEMIMVAEFTERSETPKETHEEEVENGVLERESEVKEERESSSRVLPECLLLMMCEPKLSMEVSKETWVCSTDFVRRHSGRQKPPPPPPVKSTDGQNESKVSATTLPPTGVTATDATRAAAAAVRYQQARSSCSLPAPPSMATMFEQKLVNAVGYEPFVLTRCKSEPMKSAAANLVPETCFWKNRKLEPLRRAAFGVGAAGLGF